MQAQPPKSTPLFETPRLWVRPWNMGDVDAFARIWCDPKVIFWGPAKDHHEAAAQLHTFCESSRAMPAGMGWLAVEDKSDGSIVGNVMLRPPPWARRSQREDPTAPWQASQPPADAESYAEIGYHLCRDRWGKGYATEAVGGLLEHAARLHLTTLEALILSTNAPSRALVERLGFAQTGERLHAQLPHLLYQKGLSG